MLNRFSSLALGLVASTALCSMAAEGQPDGGAGGESPKVDVKTVADDMANRRVFARTLNEDGTVAATAVDNASEYLNACADSFADFGDYPLAGRGVDSEGNFDPEIYTDSMDVMVALLRNKSKIKCIVVAPVPSIDSVLNNPAALDWATKILHKEMNHVAVRALREAEDVATVVDQIPTTLDGYINSSRDAGGGIMEAFNELYKAINATLAAKFPVWAKARLIKSELRKALESKGYASEFYPALEDYKGNSLFVVALNVAKITAQRKGMDSTIFDRWAATRDAKVYKAGEDDDSEDEFNLDSLTTALLAADQPEQAAGAGEGSTESGDASGQATGGDTNPETPTDETATGDSATGPAS